MTSIRKNDKKRLAEIRGQGAYKSKTFNTKVNALSWALEMKKPLSDESSVIRRKTMLDALDQYEVEVYGGRKGERWDRVRIN